MKTIFAFCFSITLLLVGCTNQPTSPDDVEDGPPTHADYDVSHIVNAIPKPHKGSYKRATYTVRGKTYYPLENSKGYHAQGTASWYGKKFHGRLTANGERYNMYRMTAAHRTLPLPTYLRVTNLANQRSVIVRVNDRGPFHGNRLIDLSWAAAKKLGFANHGVTRVKIVAIDPNKPTRKAKPSTKPTIKNYPAMVQVAAFKTEHQADTLKKRLQDQLNNPVSVVYESDFFKVRVGPLHQPEQWQRVKAQLQTLQLNDAFLL